MIVNVVHEQIFNPTTELKIAKGSQTKERNTEIATHPLTTETKTTK